MNEHAFLHLTDASRNQVVRDALTKFTGTLADDLDYTSSLDAAFHVMQAFAIQGVMEYEATLTVEEGNVTAVCSKVQTTTFRDGQEVHEPEISAHFGFCTVGDPTEERRKAAATSICLAFLKALGIVTEVRPVAR